MKTDRVLSNFLIIAFFITITFIVVTCKKKDKDQSKEQPVYTNGEGVIGSDGGTVTIGDPLSPIYGTAVYIPEGALTTPVTIKIRLAPDSIKLCTDSNAKVIEVQPTGLKFSVPIEITLPLHLQANLSNLQAFYLDPDLAIMEEVPIKEIIPTLGKVKIQAFHFSCYAVGETQTKANVKWYYYNGRVHLNLYITRVIDDVEYGLNSIPTKLWCQLQGIPSAKDYIDNFCSLVYGCELISWGLFEVKLYRKSKVSRLFDDKLETQKMYVLRTGAMQAEFGAKVYTSNNDPQLQYFDNLQNSQVREDFFKGKALMFNFDYLINANHPEYEYYAVVNWCISQGSFGNPFASNVTYNFELNSYESPQKLSMMDSKNVDTDTNYIFDDYQTNPWNLPPDTPSNPTPSNNSNNIPTTITLSWTCTDPENDPLTYDIYFGTSANPQVVAVNQSQTSYTPASLTTGVTYYWKILAIDSHGSTTIGSVWSFTTGSGSNNPPNSPSNPNPPNNATNVSTSTTLSWTCTDPENDPLTYDIYFGTSANPQVVAVNQSQTSYTPVSLTAGVTYYWKILAIDSYGSTTMGSTWSFTTESAGGGVPCPGMPTITDSRDGQVYPTVQIGSQCWLQKNINYSTGNSWCYDNNTSNCDTYGRLYDWQTALGSCPSGWHLPSDAEWTALTDFLGGESVAGGKMKEAGTAHWSSPNTGATNSSGFTALPGGWRNDYPNFGSLTYNALFWSSTENSSTRAWIRVFYYNYEYVYRGDFLKTNGFSARCVQD